MHVYSIRVEETSYLYMYVQGCCLVAMREHIDNVWGKVGVVGLVLCCAASVVFSSDDHYHGATPLPTFGPQTPYVDTHKMIGHHSYSLMHITTRSVIVARGMKIKDTHSDTHSVDDMSPRTRYHPLAQSSVMVADHGDSFPWSEGHWPLGQLHEFTSNSSSCTSMANFTGSGGSSQFDFMRAYNNTRSVIRLAIRAALITGAAGNKIKFSACLRADA